MIPCLQNTGGRIISYSLLCHLYLTNLSANNLFLMCVCRSRECGSCHSILMKKSLSLDRTWTAAVNQIAVPVSRESANEQLRQLACRTMDSTCPQCL
ncbi:hypothetical protein XENTR_v10005907 [Xenopus tropicalis]|nr:hypothetical protein XENTR_v10005907 [Xenopus tropicalis]